MINNLYKQDLPELAPICVDKHRACKLLDICERHFDEHFRDLPKVRIGRSVRYMVVDLVEKIASLRVEAEGAE